MLFQIAAGNGSVSMPQSSPAIHQANTIRQPVTSGLSYADTSSMSYPSSDGRNAKLPLSLHHQQVIFIMSSSDFNLHVNMLNNLK